MPERGWRTKKSQPINIVTVDGPFYIPRRIAEKIEFGNSCWSWMGATTGSSMPYGVTWFEDRRIKAHRFMYELSKGAISKGLVLDHLCRNTLCVRPSHLEPVTDKENIMRGQAPGPLAVRTNRCKRGHEFTTENTRIRNDGGRTCRECERMHHRASKARKRAAKLAERETV